MTLTFTGLPSDLTQAPARYPTVIARQGIVSNFNSIPPDDFRSLAEIGDERPLEPKNDSQLSIQPSISAARNNSSPAMNNRLHAIAIERKPSPKSGHEFLSSSPIFTIRPEQSISSLLKIPTGSRR